MPTPNLYPIFMKRPAGGGQPRLFPLFLDPVAGAQPHLTGGPGAQFTVVVGDFQFIPRTGTFRYEPVAGGFKFESRAMVPVTYTVKSATFKFTVPAGEVRFVPGPGRDPRPPFNPR